MHWTATWDYAEPHLVGAMALAVNAGAVTRQVSQADRRE